MPLPRYGVLVAQAIDRVREGSTATTPHYQVRVREPDGTDHRIAINVLSNKAPSELLYLVNDDFRHPITDTIGPLTPGWHPLESRPGTGSLDFIRGNILDPGAMRTLPHDASGPDNDLADIFDHYVGRAIADPAARLYAFGQRWGPEPSATDQVFGFLPGNGVHDIHMNQGNVPDYAPTTASGRTGPSCSTSPRRTAGSGSSSPSSPRRGTPTTSPATRSVAAPRRSSSRP